MTTVYRKFNNTAYVTETLEETKKVFNNCFISYGQQPMSEKEMGDLSLISGMTTAEIEEIVQDIISEIHTDKCENIRY